MKVHELIVFLQKFPADAEVCLINEIIPCAGGYHLCSDNAEFDTFADSFKHAVRVDLSPPRDFDTKGALLEVLRLNP